MRKISELRLENILLDVDDDGIATVALNVAFAEQKHAAHLSGKSDERLFLWSYWLLGQWLKK